MSLPSGLRSTRRRAGRGARQGEPGCFGFAGGGQAREVHDDEVPHPARRRLRRGLLRHGQGLQRRGRAGRGPADLPEAPGPQHVPADQHLVPNREVLAEHEPALGGAALVREGDGGIVPRVAGGGGAGRTSTQNFLNTIFFFNANFFFNKNFFQHKIFFSTKIFFNTKFFEQNIFFSTQIFFFNKNFFNTKFFEQNIFFQHNFFLMKSTPVGVVAAPQYLRGGGWEEKGQCSLKFGR